MNKPYFAFLILLSFISCTAKLNQYVKDKHNVNKRDGKWVEKYSADEGTLVAEGRYRQGEKTGIWRTSYNNRKYQKDVVRKQVTLTRKYFPDGKIMEKGRSRLEISERERHWFYFGPWKYYDQDGKLLYIKNYRQGQKTDSIPVIRKKRAPEKQDFSGL